MLSGQHFSLFLGKTDVGFYMPKMKKTIQTVTIQTAGFCITKMQKPASVMVWGSISAHSMGDLHISEGTIDAEAYFGEIYAAVKTTTFPRTPCLFQQDNARPHSA